MERIESEVLVANPWHCYRRDRVRRRDGSEGEYYYIDLPGSVAVVGDFPDGSVLVERCFRYLQGQWLHQLVLGHCPAGAELRAQAGRELREETGFAAGRLTLLGRCTPYSGASNEVMAVFRAEELAPAEASLEATEEIEVLRLPREEARRFLLSGPVLDGQSLAAWLLYERHLAGEEER